MFMNFVMVELIKCQLASLSPKSFTRMLRNTDNQPSKDYFPTDIPTCSTFSRSERNCCCISRSWGSIMLSRSVGDAGKPRTELLVPFIDDDSSFNFLYWFNAWNKRDVFVKLQWPLAGSTRITGSSWSTVMSSDSAWPSNIHNTYEKIYACLAQEISIPNINNVSCINQTCRQAQTDFNTVCSCSFDPERKQKCKKAITKLETQVLTFYQRPLLMAQIAEGTRNVSNNIASDKVKLCPGVWEEWKYAYKSHNMVSRVCYSWLKSLLYMLFSLLWKTTLSQCMSYLISLLYDCVFLSYLISLF